MAGGKLCKPDGGLKVDVLLLLYYSGECVLGTYLATRDFSGSDSCLGCVKGCERSMGEVVQRWPRMAR